MAREMMFVATYLQEDGAHKYMSFYAFSKLEAEHHAKHVASDSHTGFIGKAELLQVKWYSKAHLDQSMAGYITSELNHLLTIAGRSA